MPETDAHVAAVVDRGYSIWHDFLEAEQVDALRRICDDLANGSSALEFPRSTRVWDLHRRDTAFVDLLCDRRLRAVMQRLLGEHFLLSDYSLNVIRPGQPPDDWHVDYPYNEMRTRVTGPVLGMQCVLALDDFDEANGATIVQPGSHAAPQAETAGFVRFTASAGGLLLMSAATAHRAGFNGSDAARRAVLASFVERWIRPMSDSVGPGPWAKEPFLEILMGIRRPPDTLDGVPL